MIDSLVFRVARKMMVNVVEEAIRSHWISIHSRMRAPKTPPMLLLLWFND